MGASLALAGVSGCSVRPAPSIDLVPYVRRPEEVVPGKPLFFATAMTLGGAGVGLLVESHLGRPTKIEGNPDHPASLGATRPLSPGVRPDALRSGPVADRHPPRQAGDLGRRLRPRSRAARQADLPDGAGLRLLTETVVSPTLGEQITRASSSGFPRRNGISTSRWPATRPTGRPWPAFGEPVNTYYQFYDFNKKQRTADVVLSLDADFLGCATPATSAPSPSSWPAGACGRAPTTRPAADMNRLYVVETAVSNTGAKADHRLALRAGEIEAFARALAAELKVPGAPPAGRPGDSGKWLKRVAADLVYQDPEAVEAGQAAPCRRPSSWPATASRPPSTCWPTPSTTTSATSARPYPHRPRRGSAGRSHCSR